MLALLRPFLGLLEPIGFALDRDDLGVVNQTVDQGDDAGGIGEDLTPLGEGSVGRDEGGFFLIAAANDLEQQVGVAIAIGKLTHLVHDQ